VSTPQSPTSSIQQPRYLTAVVGDPGRSSHLAAACQVAARDGGHVVALVIGIVPRSLPIGSDMPELWSRLEYEAARARRVGRQSGQEIETILVLSDSAGAAAVQLAEECHASAICLAYETGLLAAVRRWRDPLWRTVLDQAPCPVMLERLQPAASAKPVGTRQHPQRTLSARR
jgi:hypothetical protein